MLNNWRQLIICCIARVTREDQVASLEMNNSCTTWDIRVCQPRASKTHNCCRNGNGCVDDTQALQVVPTEYCRALWHPSDASNWLVKQVLRSVSTPLSRLISQNEQMFEFLKALQTSEISTNCLCCFAPLELNTCRTTWDVRISLRTQVCREGLGCGASVSTCA